MVKTYPTLYSRTSTGATQIWFMEQDGHKYRSTSGQLDGQKIVAEWTEAEGKNIGRSNETSAVAQALSEIDAKYKKQLKTGYFKDIKDIDEEQYFQVMLAKSYEDYADEIDWSKGVGIQIKYNGGRIVARKDGLWTRKGEKYISIPHIEDALKPFFQKFPDAVLDGEGFNYDLRERLNEIMKLLRKTVHVTAADLQRSKELIRFYVYDGFGMSNKSGRISLQSDHYLIRKMAIDNAFFAPCFAERYDGIIGKVPTWVVNSKAELEKRYQKFLDERHEGAIIRILDQPYENKRSRYLLKYKPVDDDEFEVVSIQDGDGKFANRASTITCKRLDHKTYADGSNQFDATFKGTNEEAIECWDNRQDFVGRKITIYYNGVTGYGKPNYGRFDYNNWCKS
jgi:DNA ligase-1